MLDKHLFMRKIDELLIVFPSWEFDKSGESAALWYKQFNDLNDGEFERMVDDYIKNEKFNPTVGGLRQYVVKEHRKTKDQIEHEQMLKDNGLL